MKSPIQKQKDQLWKGIQILLRMNLEFLPQALTRYTNRLTANAFRSNTGINTIWSVTEVCNDLKCD